MQKVLLIIPAYNEEEHIVQVARRIEAYADARTDAPYQVDYVVINDGSADHTEALCRQNGVPVISLARNLGIGGAVQTGYKYAHRMDYDIAVQFDGDGQHDIESLDQVVLPVLEGKADLTVGSRFVGGVENNFKSTALRRFGIRFLSAMIRLFGGVRIKDCTSGYRAAGKAVIERFAADYPADYPEPESIVTLAKKGFRVLEVPVRMFERAGGQSSIRALSSVYYMIKVSLAIIIAGLQKKEVR